ncbi:kinase-like protein [Obba rivulosa]|uniref:Kinase-like protein n=1 Tax=Obba rivulosa TaxID=1052685 RepID=A0A8E2DE48_9APHY|nr:kinase-like protein [Obba rivulosa]
MLDVIDMSHSLHKQCLDMLRKLCGEKQIIPRSFNLSRDAMRNISAKPVASGGFAQVWRGRYGERDVALKVFRYSVLDAGDDAKVFYQEAVFWKWLRHPNITCFHGIDTTSFQGQLAMVCDWMHEGTLATFLICHHNANRLKLILDTAEGLKYLHSMGILHGDLKAVNILINEKHVACLADFGLAALHTGKLASKSLTIGSPRWMSPELLDPEEFGLERAQITPQSDVYALSWVFWEVFTGRFPYAQHKRDPTVIACISRGERHPRPKDAAPLGLSEDLWSLMEVCWSTNWEERPDIGTITKQLQILIQSDGELDEPKEWPLCVQYR